MAPGNTRGHPGVRAAVHAGNDQQWTAFIRYDKGLGVTGSKRQRSSTLTQVLESAARLQRLVPDAVLVGGSAAALHAGHRDSFDHDHVLGRSGATVRPGARSAGVGGRLGHEPGDAREDHPRRAGRDRDRSPADDPPPTAGDGRGGAALGGDGDCADDRGDACGSRLSSSSVATGPGTTSMSPPWPIVWGSSWPGRCWPASTTTTPTSTAAGTVSPPRWPANWPSPARRIRP